MKKTAKMLSVLVIMLAIIVSCAPGPDATNKVSGVINPNIPAAKIEDVDNIMHMGTGGPSFSTDKLLVNASSEVQKAFAKHVENQFKDMGIESVTPSVSGNEFILTAVGTMDGAPGTMVLKQNGADGTWLVKTTMVEKDRTTVMMLGLNGQLVGVDMLNGFPLPTGDVKNCECGYIKGTTEVRFNLGLQMSREEVKDYATKNNFKMINEDSYEFNDESGKYTSSIHIHSDEVSFSYSHK